MEIRYTSKQYLLNEKPLKMGKNFLTLLLNILFPIILSKVLKMCFGFFHFSNSGQNGIFRLNAECK